MMETIMEYVRAFFVGGAFCALAQILIDKTKLTPARILVSYVVCGVALGAVGLYKPLFDYAGAGASLPISGFGYLISKGVREAIDRDGFMGILTGGLTATAGGITAALFFGLVASLIFKSKPRNT
jgi:stage V sporulation protein AE